MTEKKKRMARVWGRDDKGTLQVEVIYLWKTRDGVLKADNLGGALKHNTEVEVLERKTGWVKVRTTIIHEGSSYPQIGWVRKSLIKF